MDAEDLNILLQKIVSVLLAVGIGVLMLVKPALFARGWSTNPVVLTINRICGVICIGLGAAMILKDLGILF